MRNPEHNPEPSPGGIPLSRQREPFDADRQQQAESCPDPPVANRPLFPGDVARSPSVLTMMKSWDEAARYRLSSTEAYGVPRVFDLFTLMAITLAFALLFALLKLLSPAFGTSPTTLTLLISGYVTLIALSQMFMYDGTNPRMASVISGPVAMLAMFLVFWIPTGSLRMDAALLISVILSAIFGFLTGYLAGAVVAGVLLIADGMRGRSQSTFGRSRLVEKDVQFDDIE